MSSEGSLQLRFNRTSFLNLASPDARNAVAINRCRKGKSSSFLQGVANMISSQLRRFATSALRNSQGSTRPGDNLPFRIDNPYRFTFVYFSFFGSAIGLPFYILKLQLQKSQ
uniref:Uncharacterized protein n=1 Tax=Graphocephala atropunctata TaxID=36148 RepID=A0A1B6K9P8_9HEMI